MQHINPEALTKPQNQYLSVLENLGLELDMMIGGILYGHREFYLKRSYDEMPDTAYPVYSLRIYVLRDGMIKINTLLRYGTRETWEEISFSPLMTRFLRKRTISHLNNFLETGLKAEVQTEDPIPNKPE